MSLHFTILGCGSSGGVPRSDGNYGECDPNEPKNNRLRCSLLVEKINLQNQKTTILIDTSPDLRQQLLQKKVTNIDAILFTHDHADQTHGIDDIRPIVYRHGKLINSYFDIDTQKSLISRFGYIFKGYEKQNYPPLLIPNLYPSYGEEFEIIGDGGKINVIPIYQKHGAIDSVGFRFDNLAYCNDVHYLPNESLNMLHNLDVLIVDCLRFNKHPSHANYDQVLEWVEILKPKKTILTNLHIDMDYQNLLNILPENIIPAFDFMEIVI